MDAEISFLLALSLTVPVLRSCSELKLAGYATDGEYRIDPDGPGLGQAGFTVYCEMNNDLTVVEHEQMLHANVPQGFELAGEFRIPVTYQGGVSIEQLANLADISSRCSQYVSVNCHNSAMWNGDGPVGFWVSRDGTAMVNWGTPTGTRGCQCSLTSGCARENRQTCNCDANDDEWRKDDGDLTDKTTLPVMELRFGDTGNERERIVYKVGPLKCYGIENDTFPSCNAWNDAGYTGEGNYLIQQPGGPPHVQKCNEISDILRPPPILRSCEELRLAGYTANDDYLIDPDTPSFGVQPFLAYCDMSSGTTVIKHDRQGPLLSVGFEDAGSHRIIVHYKGASLQQITRLTDISHSCRQYMRKECHGSTTWTQSNKMISWWVSRNGTDMTNWGTPTGTEGCPCSIVQYCHITDRRCNCDSNDYVWRQDEGYITDKETLPVWQLRIGDTGGSREVSLTTLGELECKGNEGCTVQHANNNYLTVTAYGHLSSQKSTKLYPSCDSIQELGYSGEGHYLIDPGGADGQPHVVRCNETREATPTSSVILCPDVTQQAIDETVNSTTGFKLVTTPKSSTSLDTTTIMVSQEASTMSTLQEKDFDGSTRGQSSGSGGTVEDFNFILIGISLILVIVIAILIFVVLQWRKMKKPSRFSGITKARTPSPHQRSSVEYEKGLSELSDSDSFSNVKFVNFTEEKHYDPVI